MTMINGVRIHPGFFKQRVRNPAEHRVSDAPVSARLKPTSIPKPKTPRAMYLMPVVAIIGAIGSFTAGAAIATAAGATLGAMVVGGAMMVGAAMTVVGTVTGNQKLAKWGGVLSIAGGIGALGLGAAGMLTSTADAVSSAASTGADAIVNVAGPGELASAGDVANIGSGTIDLAGSTAGDLAGGAAGTTAAGTPGATSGMLGPIDIGQPPVAATEVVASSAAPTAAAAAAPDISSLSQAAPAANPVAAINVDGMTGDMLGINTSATLPTMPKIALEQPSMWKEFQNWYKTNPELAKTLSETVKGGLAALPTDQSKAQTAYYQANTDLAKANTDRTQEETYRLWLKSYYNQGKMPPVGAKPPGG